MKERSISLETAKLIPNPKQTSYWDKCDWFYVDTTHPDGYWLGRRSDLDIDYPAPTQSLLQKWLRDVHHIHIDIIMKCHRDRIDWNVRALKWNLNMEDENNTFMDFIEDSTFLYGDNNKFPTYEDALEFGLQLGLQLGRSFLIKVK